MRSFDTLKFRASVEPSFLKAVAGAALSLAACGGDVDASDSRLPITALETTTGSVAEMPLGYDISWPQCGTDLPEPGAFAIVGANESLPTFANPCFDEQAEWAAESTGETSQPPLAVYVTSANPAAEDVQTWPNAGENRYGVCKGEDSQACAYEYGRDRAEADIETIHPIRLDDLRVWIDVEPEYSWETGAEGRLRNAAVLEGMVESFETEGAEVGIYSGPAIWDELLGDVPGDSSLSGMDIWVLGAHSAEEARANCATPSFTGGEVVVAQFVTAELDMNVAC